MVRKLRAARLKNEIAPKVFKIDTRNGLSVPKTLRFENAETLRFLFRGPKNRQRFLGDFLAIFLRFLRQNPAI